MKVFPAVLFLITFWSLEWEPVLPDSIIHIGKFKPPIHRQRQWFLYKSHRTSFSLQLFQRQETCCVANRRNVENVVLLSGRVTGDQIYVSVRNELSFCVLTDFPIQVDASKTPIWLWTRLWPQYQVRAWDEYLHLFPSMRPLCIPWLRTGGLSKTDSSRRRIVSVPLR